jgi:general secretion pathway protein G
MQRKRGHRAFTLLEMLAVITIIGIIASIVVTRVSYQAYEAKKKCCLQYKADINSAIERYHFDIGSYPASVSDLQGDYYPAELPKCPVTNLEYDMDATTGRVLGHAH